MSLRGDKTKQEIRDKAYQLFAEKGFKEVTMKEICERAGLSRGGLYRHYESTEQIFLEIVGAFSDRQKSDVCEKIRQHVPAAVILEEILTTYEKEMGDREGSFSLAICEYYSNPAVPKDDNLVKRQYEVSKSTWLELIRYGIGTKEFKCVDPEAVFHMLVFAYQGVRMYSRLMEMDRNIPAQIANEIRMRLLAKED